MTKNDTIDGGDGTDTLQLTGTLDYSTAGAGTDDASGIKGFEVLQSGGAIAQDFTGLAKNNTITSAKIGAHTVVLTKNRYNYGYFYSGQCQLNHGFSRYSDSEPRCDNGAGVPLTFGFYVWVWRDDTQRGFSRY